MLKTKWIMLACLMPLLVVGGEKLLIDLKVPIAETTDFVPAQAGASVFLMKSDWAKVSDIGEDYAVWLTEYDRHKNILGQQVISLNLEVREPSMLRIGNLIKEKRLTVRYWEKSSESDKFEQKSLNDLNDLSKELQLEAYHLGTKIESILESMLK